MHKVLFWNEVSQAYLTMWFIHPSQNTNGNLLYTCIAAYTGIIDVLIPGFYILIYSKFLHLSLKMICYSSLRENAKLTSLTQEYKTYTLVWIVLQSWKSTLIGVLTIKSLNASRILSLHRVCMVPQYYGVFGVLWDSQNSFIYCIPGPIEML